RWSARPGQGGGAGQVEAPKQPGHRVAAAGRLAAPRARVRDRAMRKPFMDVSFLARRPALAAGAPRREAGTCKERRRVNTERYSDNELSLHIGVNIVCKACKEGE